MTLDDLTKEDLIKVVANMHDTIQDWNNGWGLSEVDAAILINIGRMCADRCVNTNDWNLPEMMHTREITKLIEQDFEKHGEVFKRLA